MSEYKCKKCRKTVGNNSKSICCDSCNKWIHYKCTSLTQNEFDFHTKNELEFWRCDFCIPRICKCGLVAKHNQNKLCCKICNTWTHLKCSGLNKNDFNEQMLKKKKKKDDWYCRSCITQILPFSSIDNKKIIKLFKIEKQIP